MQKEHLEILLEDIRGKFDLVLEGYSALDKKIDTKFDVLNEKIDQNSFKIDVLNKKIDAVDERLTNQINAVEEKLGKRIDAVEEMLSERIDAVEENLTRHLEAVADDLKAHRQDTEAHRSGWRVCEGDEA
jgi:chromosome segregation ATPase